MHLGIEFEAEHQKCLQVEALVALPRSKQGGRTNECIQNQGGIRSR